MGVYLGVDAHSRYYNTVIPGPLSTFNVRVREDLKIHTGKCHKDMGKCSNFFCKHSKCSVFPSIYKAYWPNKPSVQIFLDVGMGRVSKL